MRKPLRVVLDTSVWIGIYLHLEVLDPKQPFTAIFEALCDGEFIPIFSRQTYREALYMLMQSKDVAQFYKIDPDDARDFLDSIYCEVSEVIKIAGTLRVSSDPNDNMFPETAIAAKADFFVREDRHLQEPAVHEILGQNGVRAVFPKQFRKILEERRLA